MIILVDFENTHVSGLDGYEYLNDSDTLVMYYSDENSAVTRGMVTDLKKRNVHVSLVKLLKQHSNALDMYIASTTGMFLESGEKICIVSKDKGYAAVRDFWHSLRGAEILLGETIKECFLSSEKNDDERISLCKERAQKATLVDSFATMNTIPTRPTLSKSNQRRRNRNIRFTEVSEPASLIPNPLMFETPADQLVKQMKELPFGRVPEANYSEPRFQQARDLEKAEASVESKKDYKKDQSAKARGVNGSKDESDSKDRNHRDDRRRDGYRNQGDRNRPKRNSEDLKHVSPQQDAVSADDSASVKFHQDTHGSEDISSVKSYQETEKPEEKADVKNPIVKSEPEKTAIIIRPEQKTAIAKSEPKYDPNRVQFVYDPVSRSMKKVGEDTAEKKSQTAEKEAVAEAAGAEAVSEANIQNDTPEKPVLDAADSMTEEKEDEAASGDIAPMAEEAAEKESVTVRKSAAGKTASKRRTSRKKTAAEAPSVEAAVEAETAEEISVEAETEAAVEEAAASDESKKIQEKTPAEKETQTSGKRKTTKRTAAKAKKAEDESEEAKPKKTRSRKKAQTQSKAESAEAESDSVAEQPEVPEVAPQEAVEKYGLTANTLHTYYVRLIKAYGKEAGRSVYDASKKAVQEEIKKRKAAEKAIEKTVTENNL